jgi:endonuclease/exonuclease/phosphatase family metal-dependent hydrolase
MRSLIFFSTLLSLSVATAQPVKVMSYNIRFDNPGDGVNAWPNRTGKVVEVIQKFGPDIIGVQEALHHQLEDLIRKLPDYSYVGVGRDDGKLKGEYSAILYKHARFGLLSNATFWLSETPEIPGSKSWDAAITRVATWARFFDKEANLEFFFLNTHFDHIGKTARELSALLIKSKLEELAQQSPMLISGDFNCTPAEPPYQHLVRDDKTRLYDSNTGTPVGTYCGFEVGSMECVPIDFIFHSAEWTVNRHHVLSDNDGKHYPSDHLPVLAEVVIK